MTFDMVMILMGWLYDSFDSLLYAKQSAMTIFKKSVRNQEI